MKFEKGDIVYWMGSDKAFGIVIGDCEYYKGCYKLYVNGSYDTHSSCSGKNLRHATHDEKGLLITALAKENKYYCEKTKTIKEMKKEFTKKDLKSGMWVELRNGEQHIVILNSVSRDDELLVDIISDKNGYLNLDNYSCSLNNEMYDAYDIMRVFNMHRGCLISGINTNSNLIWERETEEDKQMKEMQNKLDEMKKAYNELEKNISETLDKLNGLKK